MNTTIELLSTEDGLKIGLNGKITSDNAMQIDSEIVNLRKEYPNGKISLDAENLKYISSAGLRILMKILKNQGSLEMFNASSEVYEILDLTGFVDLMTVHRAIRSISLEGCQILGEGGHGTVYRLTDDSIVKLYRTTTTLEEIYREQEYSRKAFVLGVPTAIPFDVVKCDDRFGLIFELMNSDTLSNRIKKEPEKLEEFAVKYATLLKDLHNTKVSDDSLSSAKKLYSDRIDALSKWLTPEEVEKLHKIHNAIPEGNTIVHGDYHPKNIMMQNDDLLLIDMADITYGHPLYDLGSTFLTHVTVSDARKESITGLPVDMVNKLWMIFLKTYLGTDDPAVIEVTARKAGIVATLKSATALAFSPDAQVQEFIINHLMGVIRERLIPNTDQLVALLSH